jgi:hypothetical protein
MQLSHGSFLPQIHQFWLVQGEPEQIGRRLFGRRQGISRRQKCLRPALLGFQYSRYRRGLPGRRLPRSHHGHSGLTRIVSQDPHYTDMNLTWKPTLRTPSSERFLAERGGNNVAAVDLHYLTNGTIASKVIILKDSAQVDSLLDLLQNLNLTAA